MIDILRRGASAVVRSGRKVSARVWNTLAKISLCQTAALGGRYYRCHDCQQGCLIYNSCGDRHCPQCRGARRTEWAQQTERLLLQGIDYYQVVFTLPEQLSSLALGNREALYKLLFDAAWQALSRAMKSEHGIDPSALMVLHTWNQRLEHHPHIHAVVPGAGPSLGGDRWVRCGRAQRPDGGDAAANYLVDADRLREAWRQAFLKGLDRLYSQGELKLRGSFEVYRDRRRWQAWLGELAGINWVSFIQPPPCQSTEPEQLVRYLSRYLTGGPISDHRIIAADSQQVTLLARQGTTPGGDRIQLPIDLSIEEFVRRWSLHILPRDFTKVRRFGGWSNRRCGLFLERCAIMMEAARVPLSPSATEFDVAAMDESIPDVQAEGAEDTAPLCPCCGRPMQPDRLVERPPCAPDIRFSFSAELVRGF